MKITDIIIILLIIFLGTAGLVYSFNSPGGDNVSIQTPYGDYDYPLNKNTLISVRGLRGPYKIEIKDNRVRAIEADCPLQLCIKKGWINRDGDSIVCIPNRVIIRIEKKGQKIDAVTE